MAKSVPENDLKQIIEQGNAETLVNTAQTFGTELFDVDKLSKSQIRNVFGEVRQIEAEWQSDSSEQASKNMRRLLLLKPRMAYQRAREKKTEALMILLTAAIDLVAKAKAPQEQYLRFRHFVEFFEAILAYHTAAGGK
ncbi:MAG: type III-A CRISPR-associated protein Csm2 [Caldilineaceae bacterium]